MTTRIQNSLLEDLAEKQAELAGFQGQRDDLTRKIGSSDPVIERLNLRIATCRDEVMLLAEQVRPQHKTTLQVETPTHAAVRKIILEGKRQVERTIIAKLDEIVQLASDYRLDVHRLLVEHSLDYSDANGEFQIHICHPGASRLLADPPQSDCDGSPEEPTEDDPEIWR